MSLVFFFGFSRSSVDTRGEEVLFEEDIAGEMLELEEDKSVNNPTNFLS
jgi:hypothetical protein